MSTKRKNQAAVVRPEIEQAEQAVALYGPDLDDIVRRSGLDPALIMRAQRRMDVAVNDGPHAEWVTA